MLPLVWTIARQTLKVAVEGRLGLVAHAKTNFLHGNVLPCHQPARLIYAHQIHIIQRLHMHGILKDTAEMALAQSTRLGNILHTHLLHVMRIYIF